MSSSAVEPLRTLAEEILRDTAFSLERPVSCGGLSFIPISEFIEDAHDFEYINTSEALELGVLELIEGGDAVNTIIAYNKGTIPILIEEAEVLSATGTQDRIVVSSVLIEPGKKQRIPVKCVHAPHGLYAGSGFGTLGSSSYGLREEIRRQKYCSIMTDVEHYVPETAVDQSVIWERVREYCKVAGTTDPTKYTEALEELKKKASADAKQVMSEFPETTCGVIVIDSSGEVISLEMYRKHQSFQKRGGFIESILMEYGKKDEKSMEEEAAWAKAIQLLMKLRDINEDEIVAKEDSANLTVGMRDLKGEVLTSDKEKSSRRTILYCSLGK